MSGPDGATPWTADAGGMRRRPCSPRSSAAPHRLLWPTRRDSERLGETATGTVRPRHRPDRIKSRGGPVRDAVPRPRGPVRAVLAPRQARRAGAACPQGRDGSGSAAAPGEAPKSRPGAPELPAEAPAGPGTRIDCGLNTAIEYSEYNGRRFGFRHRVPPTSRRRRRSGPRLLRSAATASQNLRAVRRGGRQLGAASCREGWRRAGPVYSSGSARLHSLGGPPRFSCETNKP